MRSIAVLSYASQLSSNITLLSYVNDNDKSFSYLLFLKGIFRNFFAIMEKYVLVDQLSAINSTIHNTFQSTQRIKFTAFDVSAKYIIFGVNSGGIYIFSRESCQFLKLIPSTHGPANSLLISDDETDLAIAVSTGLVIILEDCFGATFQQQIFSEHEGNTITAMRWNGNDLYCGDSSGKVSVITLKSFLTKAMFQTPIACLMHLDSQIVQLDTYSKFLLISTLTRSLICDTESERYRQIGKKARDGPFGACFFNALISVNNGSVPHARGAFQTASENEQLSLSKIDESVRIFCARPGARLWQADLQANVIFTHQFRPSLSQKQSDVICWDDSVDADLKITRSEGQEVGENFSFGKVFRLLNKFILTFRDDGFYIFEPSSSALLFWRRLKKVKDIKIINSILYIWHRNLEVTIVSLLSVEELILKSLLKRQYLLCGQLCVEFFEEVEALIGKSKKIHLISALESKLDNREVLDKLSPIMKSLKDCAKTPTLEKFKNGIVTVNKPETLLPESVQNFDGDKNERKDPNHIISEQYRINKIHKNIETTDFSQLMKSSNLEKKFNLIANFSKENENCDLWCKEMFLKYLKVSEDFSADSLNYACEAFLRVNETKKSACDCNFPLPKAHKNEPKYYEIACLLMEKSDSFEAFTRKVPYMQRYILEKIDDLKEIQLKLPLIIQYSDPKIIRILSKKMCYDVWDDSMQLLLKLKSGNCLHCGSKIDVSGTFQWRDFGVLMVQSIRATNAMKLLKRYAKSLPKGELDAFFYQYCVFSAVSNTNGNIFDDVFSDEGVKKQFEASVGGYLRKRYLRGGDYDPPIKNKLPETVPSCDHCQLPLKIPIIEETRLRCGHNYHQLCFLYNKNQCRVCETVL